MKEKLNNTTSLTDDRLFVSKNILMNTVTLAYNGEKSNDFRMEKMLSQRPVKPEFRIMNTILICLTYTL